LPGVQSQKGDFIEGETKRALKGRVGNGLAEGVAGSSAKEMRRNQDGKKGEGPVPGESKGGEGRK